VARRLEGNRTSPAPRQSNRILTAMLKSIEHGDHRVCTVFSLDVAIGGLLFTDEDRWLWALLVVPDARAKPGAAPPFGGVAATKEQALAALEDRWNTWLEAAGLVSLSGLRAH
jgi:hypothetical protein